MTLSLNETTPIQLVYMPNTADERIVVSFPEGIRKHPVFGPKDKYLEEAMKTNGVVIPLQQRENYPEFQAKPNRKAIYLTDASFGKAFYEVHFANTMDPDKFKWIAV